MLRDTRCFRVLLGAMVVAWGISGAAQAQEEDYIIIKGHKAHPTRLLAKYKPGVRAARLAADGVPLEEKERFSLVPGLVVLDEPRMAGRVAADIKNDADRKVKSAELARRMDDLKNSGLFEYVEPDYLVYLNATPTDSAFADGTLWGLRNTGQSGGVSGADIGAVQAWDITTGSRDVIVAVIDTGIRYTHRDLAPNMWRNPGEIPGNGIDDDNDGYVDNVFGINAITGSGDPMDDEGHGTHVAGTIGATANDGNQHVGVAWNVRLMACKFLGGSNGGKTSDEIKCIDFAVSKGARIINASYRGYGYRQSQHEAIARAHNEGVLFVAAAANDAKDNDVYFAYPASLPENNVISVAALDRRDTLASFSNYGANSVDVGAPGVEIYSCGIDSDSDYKNSQGTSMAAPHVAGVAALVLSRYPGMTVGDLRRVILNSVVPVPALQGKTVTGGRVNAFNALNAIADGQLELTVQPPPGSTLLSGSTIPLIVSVSDVAGVSNATITASIVGSTNLSFNNAGTAPDAAFDASYSAWLTAPVFANTVTINLSISAPGKQSTNIEVSYSMVVPQANNSFEKRSQLTGASAVVSGSTLNADKQTSEPNHAGNDGGRSVWWTWTAPGNGRVQISTAGSSFDTLLAVYVGSALAGLSPVAANDDFSSDGGHSQVSFPCAAGATYQIAIDGFAAAAGDYQLQVQFVAGSFAPANDAFSNPATLSGSPAGITSNNFNATKESNEPLHAGYSGGASVWFNWTAPSSGLAVLTTYESSFDTLLAVYTGTTLSGLSLVTANDDDPDGGTTSRVLFTASAGQTYRIAVDGYGGATGNIVLSVLLATGQTGPVNDLFQNAIALSGNSVAVSGTNVGATKSNGEPNHAGNSGGRSVWWNWTASANGVCTISTAGSSFDTLLAVYTGTAVNALSLVVANDDDPAGGSKVSFFATSGTTYRIAVDGYNGWFTSPATGSIALSLTHNTGIRPANDNFANRITLTGNLVSTNGSNIAGTKEAGEPNHAANTGGRSVWWTWTATTTGYAEIKTSGSNFDTTLAVYTGSSVSALTPVASNDNDPDGGTTSSVFFGATEGTTYQIAVDGVAGAAGNISLSIQQLARVSFGVGTYFDANEGLIVGQPLAGQDGWTKVGSGGNGLVDNFFNGKGQQAYIGFSPPAPGDTELRLRQPVNFSPTTNEFAFFTVRMKIENSSNSRYDYFKWRFYNRDGTRLFTLGFDNQSKDIYFVLDDDVYRSTGYSFNNSTIYDLLIYFDFVGNSWSAKLGSTTIVDGWPISLSGLTRDIGSIDPIWTVRTSGQAGNNYMLFDDYFIFAIERLHLPAIVTSPQSVSVTAGASPSLTVTATGTAPLSYQWYRDGEILPNATSATLSLPNIQVNQSGRYKVRVTNSVGSATSDEAVVIVRSMVLPPSNDHFASRIVITGSSNVVFGVNSAATKQTGEPTHAGNIGGKSVWWSWTAPSTGQYLVTTAGSDFDTLLAIYTGTAVGSLVQVAAADDPQSQTRSASIPLNAVAGTTYQIAVDGYNGHSGNVRLAVRPLPSMAFQQPAKLQNGSFQTSFMGEPGIRYQIQISTNLVNWTTVTTVVGQDGVLNYLDAQAPSASARFYRAVKEP